MKAKTEAGKLQERALRAEGALAEILGFIGPKSRTLSPQDTAYVLRAIRRGLR